jgi:Glu-tRNA(Gln) amidotransferase subunit E-like FAD-binding protein
MGTTATGCLPAIAGNAMECVSSFTSTVAAGLIDKLALIIGVELIPGGALGTALGEMVIGMVQVLNNIFISA